MSAKRSAANSAGRVGKMLDCNGCFSGFVGRFLSTGRLVGWVLAKQNGFKNPLTIPR
jgi:hypothetical protein